MSVFAAPTEHPANNEQASAAAAIEKTYDSKFPQNKKAENR